MNHIVKGDYVLTPVSNAFNGKTSYWISKKGFSIALYAFSADNEEEAAIHIREFDVYIRMFKDRAEKTATFTITGNPGFITGVSVGETFYSIYGEIPCSHGDIVTLYHAPGRFWYRYDTKGKLHRMDSVESCYFTVPPYAEGKAELFIRNGLEDYLYDAIRLDRSKGWVIDGVFGY